MLALRHAMPLCLLALLPGLVLGQTPDPAAERARLANERIQAEAERRAQEELALQAAGAPVAAAAAPAVSGGAEARPVPAPVRAGEPPPKAPGPPADDERTQRALQQLRELGQLKDAGYVTEAEFQRIKQRIMESHFQD